MNLDDLTQFANLDKNNMLSHIEGLPDQLQSAWELGFTQPLPVWSGIRHVLVAGMGGSAIGADLLAAYAGLVCSTPIIVHRDYGLPVWARGPETLVVASSHSGNTEETLSAFEQALVNQCRCLVITTGGKLAELGDRNGTPVWRYVYQGQPRAAVGFSFGLLLGALTRLNLLPDSSPDLREAVLEMKDQQAQIQPGVPAAKNPAKRLAGQLVGRWVTVLGSGVLAPVARRWKGQINELAKAWAQFEIMPEADHNTLAGVELPQPLIGQIMALFLRAPSDFPRNRLRNDLTRKIFMLEGLNTDFVDARGNSPLAHLWTCLHLGDYVAYFLAMAYGVDPTPISAIESLKNEMRGAE